MRKTISALALLATVAPSLAADLPYFYDLLKKPAYKHSLELVLKGEPVEPWVSTFIKTQDGVSDVGKPRTIAGAHYELYWVCKPHDCGDNSLNAIFTPGGSQVWAVLTKGGTVAQIYGHPDAAMKQALLDAAKGSGQ